LNFEQEVRKVCDEIAELLIAKNKQYGNSALEPIRCFSKLDPIEQIKIACDHKISRLMRGEGNQEDTELDLMGYLVLLRIAEKRKLTQMDVDPSAKLLRQE
jgi:hypothetical protein